MKCITSLDHLKEISKEVNFECQLLLKGGLFSRKTISYDPEEFEWTMYNHIDDSEDVFISDDDFKQSYPLLFEAIEKGALIYDPENCFV